MFFKLHINIELTFQKKTLNQTWFLKQNFNKTLFVKSGPPVSKTDLKRDPIFQNKTLN